MVTERGVEVFSEKITAVVSPSLGPKLCHPSLESEDGGYRDNLDKWEAMGGVPGGGSLA